MNTFDITTFDKTYTCSYVTLLTFDKISCKACFLYRSVGNEFDVEFVAV